MITDIDAIEKVCEEIKQKKFEDAKKIIKRECRFDPIVREKRKTFTEDFKTELLWRDGFIDRYAFAGSPGEVADKVLQLGDIPEISQVVITLPPSGGSYPTTDSIMKNFAKAVIHA